MKGKYIIYIMFIIVLSSLVYANQITKFTDGTSIGNITLNNKFYCFQNEANITSLCGGLSTGKYSYIESSGNIYNFSKFTDGNKSTYASIKTTSDSSIIIYINYTKVVSSESSKWEIKDSFNNINLTIPNSCFNNDNDTLKLRIVVSYQQNLANRFRSYYYCYNGTWNKLLENDVYSSSNNKLYDQSMHWYRGYKNTKYIEVPSYPNVSSAYFNITGNILYLTTEKSCIQESANVSTDCGGVSTGSYWGSSKFNDNNYTSYITSGTGGLFYYYLPVGATNESKIIFTDVFNVMGLGGFGDTFTNHTLSINQTCWDYAESVGYLTFSLSYDSVDTSVIYLYCVDPRLGASQFVSMYVSDDPLVSWSPVEDAMNWTIINTNVTKNPFIYVGDLDLYQWNYTGYFYENINFSFVNKLNNILPECSCSGCSIINNNCNIPINIVSDTYGSIKIEEFYINYTNLLTIYVKDENTGNLITNKNVSVELFNNEYNYNYTTQTSNDTINLDLPLSNLNIRYSGVGYSERIITLDLTESDNEITLYLLNSSSSQECSSVVYNELGSPQENVYVGVYKYSSYNNNYNFVGSYLTNFEGKTNIYLELNSEYYQFKLYYPSTTLRETTTPTYIYTCPITFQINTNDDIADDFFKRQQIISNLTFNNNTNTFRLTYQDNNNISDRYCLYIYTNYTSELNLYNYSCLSTHSGTISKTITAINNTLFISKFKILQEGYWYTLKALNYKFVLNDNTFKTNPMGLFLILILSLIFVFMAQKYILTLILVPIPLIIGSAFEIINIQLPYAIGIGLFGLIIGFIISREK